MTRHPLQPPRRRAALDPLRRAGRVAVGLAATVLLVTLLVGIPYGLARGVGWPLPHHWPTPSEIKATLTGPFTDRILLDTLGCLCWLIWAVFVADTLRAIPDAIHDARQAALRPRRSNRDHGHGRRAGPLRGLATVLLAAIVSGLLSLRPHPALAAGPAGWATATPRPAVVVSSVPARLPATAGTAGAAARAQVSTDRASGAHTATVQPPHDGIHDSLWRVAQRCLGDGDRWPEIYRLNQGLPQPDGESLQRPSLVQPGWILRLPTATRVGGAIPPTSPAPGPHDGPAPPATPTFPPTKPTPPTSTRPTSTPPSTGHAASSTPASSASASTPAPASLSASPVPGGSSVHATGRGGGIDLGDGAFVGFGLAGAVSTALLVTRRRRRRSYVPGSGRRDDLLPVAPVVRTLHLAHLRATTPAAERIDELGDADAEADLDLGARAESVDAHLASDAADIDMDVEAGHAPRPTGASSPSPQTVALASATLPGVPAGVATRQEVAVDLAALHGLGLVGPGAAGTTRSLIVHLLTTTNSTGSSDRARSDAPVVVVPAEIAAALQFPEPTRLPARLRVVSDLTDALDAAETELLHHARLATTSATRESSRGTAAVSLGLVVVSSVPADTRRLQAIIDAGTGAGVAAILLGQWRPGTSLYVDADGTVTATSPGPGEPLRGARLFHLHPDDTAALLDQLHAADPSVSPPVAQRSDQTADMPFAGAERDGAERDGPERDSLSRPAPHRPAETLAAQPSTVFSPPGHLVAASMPMSPGGEDGPAAVVSDVVTAAQSADGAPVPGDRRESAPGFESSVLALTVFGPIRLTFSPADPHTAPANGAAVTGDITGTLSPRLRELLVLLAIHPDGITRDRLADLLWPDTPAERPFATLNKNLARLRRTIATATAGTVPEIALTFGDRHQLDPQAVQTDFRVFSDALAARRAARSDEERVLAYRHVVAAYRGELAEGLAAEWLDTSREAVRRDAVDAATSLARQLVATEPRAALDLLETGRAFDPYNEAIYCDIMRLQRRLGHSDAIERTLALLTARLGELEEQPRAETLALAQRLQTAATQTAPSPPARSTQTSR